MKKVTIICKKHEVYSSRNSIAWYVVIYIVLKRNKIYNDLVWMCSADCSNFRYYWASLLRYSSISSCAWIQGMIHCWCSIPFKASSHSRRLVVYSANKTLVHAYYFRIQITRHHIFMDFYWFVSTLSICRPPTLRSIRNTAVNRSS